MKAVVDTDTCTGCELCVSEVPDVFKMDGDVAVAIDGEVPSDLEQAVREAAEDCPVEAISVN